MAFAQPVGIVVALLDAGAQQGKVAVRVGGDGVHGAQNMLGQRQVRSVGRIDVHPLQPKAAGLKAVEGVHEVVVLAGRKGLGV